MRAWNAPVVVAVAAIISGCASPDSAAVLATTGPNQVVLRVPNMT